MAEINGSKTIFAAKHLRLENYDAFYNNPSALPSITIPPFNEILHLHGYSMLRFPNKKKEKIMEALSGVENLLSPHRSTLNETLSSSFNSRLTLNEVNADLTALKWQEEIPVETLQIFPFTNNTDVVHASDVERTRVRKVTKRKVFDAVHLTKPRSKKNCVKRKHLSEIIGFGQILV